jgi:hypothetical protein
VVVRDFDFEGMAFLPTKADPELLVDPDAVLTRAIVPECLQPVSRRNSEVLEIAGSVDLVEPPPGDDPQRRRASLPRSARVEAVVDVLGAVVAEDLYHGLRYNGRRESSSPLGAFTGRPDPHYR